MADSIRLDRFLWFARLAKTRSLAQAIASDGRLRIDGRAIDRAHAAVRVGNILTFAQAGRVRVLRVEALPSRRGPAPEAQACYQELSVNVAAPARSSTSPHNQDNDLGGGVGERAGAASPDRA